MKNFITKIGLALTLLLIINNVNVVRAQNGDIDNNNTNTTTCINLSYDMRRGSRDASTNNEVTKLQEALIQTNYLNQDPSGYFGNATYAAVQRFQTANGLISSGYVGSYTRSAIQSITCNNTSPYPTPAPYISLIPTSLPSIIYDKDSSGLQLRGINFVDSSYNAYNLGNVNVSIINTNISGINVNTSSCAGVFGTSASGPVYANYAMGACTQNTQKIIAVDFNNINMTDNTYYYFTIRINQNGNYVDKQYSFTYKKTNTNNSNNTTCTYRYKNGVYGCYYNGGPDVSNCQYTGYYNNCNTGGYNGGYYNGNGSGYYNSDSTFILY